MLASAPPAVRNEVIPRIDGSGKMPVLPILTPVTTCSMSLKVVTPALANWLWLTAVIDIGTLTRRSAVTTIPAAEVEGVEVAVVGSAAAAWQAPNAPSAVPIASRDRNRALSQ